MYSDVVYGNAKRIPFVDKPAIVKKVPDTGINFLLMSRVEFFQWLDENNRTAKPIKVLIEEYK